MSGPHGGTHTLLGGQGNISVKLFLWPACSGGSLTRYRSNLSTTLGAHRAAFKLSVELRRAFTPPKALLQKILRQNGASLLSLPQVYPEGMIQLPASYQEYLAGKSESVINTVRPILMQSAADKLHGVRVVVHPHDHQAHLDDTIPFGTVIEDID